MRDQQREQYVEYEQESRGGSLATKPFKLLFNLALKIVFSPLIVLILAYLYFEDFREAYLVALIFYSGLTLISLLMSIMQIFMSMMTFNLFKFIRKSFKTITLIVALVIYWASYVLIWGTNFDLAK